MGDQTRFSLEELADAAGMTARNVRAYQTRGLIPAPLRVGRRSEYTVRHLEALRAVQRARAEGASLTLIAQCLSRDGVVDLTRVTDGWLPAPRPAGPPRPAAESRPVRDTDPADLSVVLARARVADDPASRAAIDSLVAAGVATRRGRRIVAGRDLVASVTALHRHGVPVQLALQVATRAAESGATLTDRLGELVDPRHRTGDGRRLERWTPPVAEQLAELAAGVLRGVVADRLAGRPTRPPRPTTPPARVR